MDGSGEPAAGAGPFRQRPEGNLQHVFALALVLIVLGLLGLLVFPWGGIAAAAVGLVLLVVYLLGAGRTAARSKS